MSTGTSHRRSDPGRVLRCATGWSRVARGFRVGAACILLIGGLGGCESDQPEGAPTTEPEYEGLSREEIEQRAEPMTPAEAERLGIVDTTIRIEPPVNPDSALLDSLSGQ